MQCSGSVGGPEIARYYRHWPVFHVSATFTTRGHVTLERALNVRAARAVTTMDFSSNARGNRFVSIAIVPEIPFSPYHAVHRPRNLENWPTIDTETKRFVCNNKVVFQFRPRQFCRRIPYECPIIAGSTRYFVFVSAGITFNNNSKKLFRISTSSFLFSRMQTRIYIFAQIYLIFVWIIFYANIARDTTTYNKLLEIESEDRVYLEKEIRNMNSFEGYSHPDISFIGSFIHSFIFSFFFLSFPTTREIEWNRVRFIRARSTTATSPLPLPTPCARNIAFVRRERCYPCPSPPHLGFSITTTTTRSLRSLRLKARFTARVPRPRFHCARERIILPHRSPLFPFRFPPLSSVQRIKRRKGASTASNRRIFQFLEKLFNFHPFDEFRPNLSFMLHEVILIWIEL